jgi:hypothetical protein
MSVKSTLLEITQANAVATATQPVVFGPIYVGDLERFSITLRGSATATVTFAYKFSFNENREGEVNAVLDNFDQTAILSLTTGTSVNIAFCNKVLFGHNYITILASSTATVPSSALTCVVTGKRFN